GEGARAGGRIEIRMQPHVEHRELDLAQHAEAALEVLGGEHAVEQLLRYRRTRLDVARHVAHDVPFPAEVLHELAGELDRIPFHAADARDGEILDAREEMV